MPPDATATTPPKTDVKTDAKAAGAGKADERVEHERLTSLINSMADAVIAVDEDIKVVMYNAAALNIFDVNSIKVGSKLSSLLAPVDKNNQPHDITEMVRAAKTPTTSRDLLLPYPDGSKINLYLSIAPVHLGYGKHGEHGYVLLLRDITREKSLEEERDEFISVVSHELRTPIAISEGNIGNAEYILEKSGDMDAIKQALKEAHNQVLFLADMINDLSTLSRAERGKLTVEVEPINVHDLVTELANNYTPDAQAKHLKVKTVLDPRLELLHSSKLYVREVLQNFITNAIKYTASGSVTIAAKAVPKGVEFAVSDTGIGISKGDQERVFDKFFRSEDYRTRQANGTGLGLYVTMKLARLLHADIKLDSELNRGSTFTVFIPNLE
ncbi:MAG TPA: ATP-binding protein [Candidatus Saccharimonadales bacterium]|nr:ATP-binding protein [Candidatus Saccharimonadales bacterium]